MRNAQFLEAVDGASLTCDGAPISCDEVGSQAVFTLSVSRETDVLLVKLGE